MNVGKVFEQNFKNSVPKDVWIYRPPDAAQSFGGGNLRFSSKSPCDYFVHNGEYLLALELKTVAGDRISFERSKDDKGEIHYWQLEFLKDFNKYENQVGGLLIDFRKSESTYFIYINDFLDMIDKVDKKSVNIKDITTLISPIEIEKKKLKVNYRYNVNKLLDDIKL